MKTKTSNTTKTANRDTSSDKYLTDRYRPAAVLALMGDQPFHLAQCSSTFNELLIATMSQFSGDTTDAIALISEDDLVAEAEAIQPVTAEELQAAFPVLASLGETLRLKFEDQLLLVFLLEAQGRWFWETWSKELGAASKRESAARLEKVLGLRATSVLKMTQSGRPLQSNSFLRAWPIQRSADVLSWFTPRGDLDLSNLRSLDAWKEFFDAQFATTCTPSSELDFSHVDEDLQLIEACLATALKSGSKGIHVLIYGPPGTGKTTLARSFARRLAVDMLEIRKKTLVGAEPVGDARLRNFNLCHKFSGSGRECLVLFDELEDVLPTQQLNQPRLPVHKGWICESLENSSMPTIWTANSLSGIDPAILRRFTFTLELGIPSRKTRQAMLRAQLPKRGPGKDWIARISANEHLTPAMIQQLTEVVAALPQTGQKLERSLEHWLNARLKAMGTPPLATDNGSSQFRCELLNADISPEQLIEGLARSGEGRVCLYGPPGTGKTAFAKYVAERLDRAMVVRRGSDLRSMWVGEIERNVAAMFAEANRNDAVLILDEADSFLSHRAHRRLGWQVNECSEFLVQLDTFRGIFFATTNRFEELDTAFIRRFDLKVECNYLTLEQRIVALRCALRDQGCTARLNKESQECLKDLGELTPGDFVAATRKLRLLDERTTQDRLVSALVHEVECKNINISRPIGFR